VATGVAAGVPVATDGVFGAPPGGFDGVCSIIDPEHALSAITASPLTERRKLFVVLTIWSSYPTL